MGDGPTESRRPRFDRRWTCLLRHLRLPIAPEPAERVGQDGAAVPVAVEALAVDELVVVVGEGQRLGHCWLASGQLPLLLSRSLAPSWRKTRIGFLGVLRIIAS